jgi:hypothetical protein
MHSGSNYSGNVTAMTSRLIPGCSHRHIQARESEKNPEFVLDQDSYSSIKSMMCQISVQNAVPGFQPDLQDLSNPDGHCELQLSHSEAESRTALNF